MRALMILAVLALTGCTEVREVHVGRVVGVETAPLGCGGAALVHLVQGQSAVTNVYIPASKTSKVEEYLDQKVRIETDGFRACDERRLVSIRVVD